MPEETKEMAKVQEEGTQETSVETQKESGVEKTEERTFSQEEVNALLAKERRKWNKGTPKKEEETPAKEQKEGDSTAGQLDRITSELAEARAQLEAYRTGLSNPVIVEDAVALAMRELQKTGVEQSQEGIKEALQSVMKRHPEWSQSEENSGGIKVGAESQKSRSVPKKEEQTAEKPWNRFKK